MTRKKFNIVYFLINFIIIIFMRDQKRGRKRKE